MGWYRQFQEEIMLPSPTIGKNAPASILEGKYRSSNEYSVVWEGSFRLSRLKNIDGIHPQYTNSRAGEEVGDDESGISEVV